MNLIALTDEEAINVFFKASRKKCKAEAARELIKEFTNNGSSMCEVLFGENDGFENAMSIYRALRRALQNPLYNNSIRVLKKGEKVYLARIVKKGERTLLCSEIRDK